MSEKTLKCDNIRVQKKEFHKYKQATDLDLIVTNLSIAMVVLNILLVVKKTKLINRYVLSQMTRYIEYLQNIGKKTCLS